MYKFYIKSIVTAYFIIIIFAVSGAARSNNEAQTDLSGQTGKSIRTRAKLKNKMSDSITGRWAGKHITLEVIDKGANIEYDCASGAINQKIILDKKRYFKVSGTHAEEHGGPVRQNASPDGYAVKYTGIIKGDRMTLVVRRAETGELVGRFLLFRGQEPQLVKCR